MQTVVIGLISDTHIPMRWKQLPEAVFSAFAGVDLIIHSGDVGELWVLDQLSAVAPVVAVHGNDETDAATQALPFLQTVGIGGRRLVVTHGHYPDRALEMAQRKDDRWFPKLSRWANFGKQHGAEIVIYGHTHIPFVVQYDGVWLVNPGAIASGGVGIRQKIQTCARLHLNGGQSPQVEYVNLSDCEPPAVDLDAGFIAARDQFSEPILTPELTSQWDFLVHEVYPLAPDDLMRVFLPVAHRCWAGEQDVITEGDFVEMVRQDARLSAAVLEVMKQSPVFAPYL